MKTYRLQVQIYMLVGVLLFVSLACGSGRNSPTPDPTPIEDIGVTAEPPPWWQQILEGSLRNQWGGYEFLAVPDVPIVNVFEHTYTDTESGDFDPNQHINLWMDGFLTPESATLEQIYAEAVRDLNLEISETEEILVDGAPGLSVDIIRAHPDGTSSLGRLVVVQVNDHQRFILLGQGPADAWQSEFAHLFEAVLASMRFFDLDPLQTVKEGVNIDSMQVYLDQDDRWYFLGLATNHTDTPITQATFEIAIFDVAGQRIFADFVQTTPFFYILPGESCPFRLTLPEDLAEIPDYVVSLIGYYPVPSDDYVQLEPENTRLTLDDNGDLHITGEIVNATQDRVIVSALTGAAFDPQGEILVAGSAATFLGDLPPGASGPFRLTIQHPDADHVAQIKDYQIYMSGHVDESRPDDFSLTLDEDIRQYVDSQGNLHLVGQVTNQGDQARRVDLWAAFYDTDGYLLDVDLVYQPFVSLLPAETVPFDFDGWGLLNATRDLLDQAVRYAIWINVPQYTRFSADEYFDLATTNDQISFIASQATFTGQVINHTSLPVDEIIVIVRLVDVPTGVIVGTGYQKIGLETAAGKNIDYSISIDLEPGFDQNSVEYDLIVKAKHPEQ